MNSAGIDIDTLKLDADNKKFVNMGYITEYPDVTVIYVRHEYSKSDDYLLIKDSGLTKEVVAKLNSKLKQYGLKAFLEEIGSSSSITSKLIIQPIGYKAL